MTKTQLIKGDECCSLPEVLLICTNGTKNVQRVGEDALNKWIQLLCLLLIGLAFLASTHASETLMLSSNDAEYRALKMQSYRGLPRLGVPDTDGFFPLHKGNAQPYLNSDAQRQALAQYQWERKEHARALWLLVNLRFLQQYPGCFSDLSVYQARVESCDGLVIPPSKQTLFQDYFLEMMANTMTDSTREKFYCPDGSSCSSDQISRVNISAENGGRRPINEFEKRELFSDLVSQQLSKFNRIWPTLTLPDEAYFVSLVELGDYNFSTQAFNFRLPLQVQIDRRDTSSKSSHRFNAINSPIYTPEQPFEKELPTQGLLVTDIGFPAQPGKARQLVDELGSRRYVYAVIKVRFENKAQRFLDGNLLAASMRNSSVPYHLAENQVELFFDEALQNSLGKVPVSQVNPNTSHVSSNSAPDSRYQFKPNSRHFDHRVLHLLRFKESNLLEGDLKAIADAIVYNEKRQWRTVASREQDARRPLPQGKTAEQQKRFADQKIRLENMAKWNSINWLQRETLSPRQQKDYFDFLLGYFSGSAASTGWPSSLKAIPWGTNFSSIFPRGHFSEVSSEAAIGADKQTSNLVQEFLKEAADSQSVDHVTMVLGIKGIQYDDKARRLSAKLPIFELGQTTYVKPNETHDRGSSLLAAEIARDRTLYSLSVSNRPAGAEGLEPDIRRCKLNAGSQSQDCVTSYKEFMQLPFFHGMLALDRKLLLDSVDLSPERYTELLNSNSGKGWRMVIELSRPKMHVIPFVMKNRGRKPENAEVQTVTANVERVLWLAPNGEILWQREGKELATAVEEKRLVADKAVHEYRFPDVVPLVDEYGQLDGVVADILLAKFAPQRLNSRMLTAMLSARWAYELNESTPVGGRFFKPGARQPDAEDLARLVDGYKAWLEQLGEILPEKFSLKVKIQYDRHQFTVANQCIDILESEGVPIKNSQRQTSQERQALQKCESDKRQANVLFERCQSTQENIVRLEKTLTAAQTKGCRASQIEILSDVAPLDASSISSQDLETRCGLGAQVPLNELSNVMQNCMTEVCGATPTTIGELQSWQICIKQVTEQLQTVMTSALTGAGSSNRATTSSNQGKAKKAPNQCAVPQRELAQARGRFEQYQCDTHLAEPTNNIDCQETFAQNRSDSAVAKLLKFKEPEQCVAEALSRGSRLSATLLPSSQPYLDTIVSLAFEVDGLAIPYEPPVPKHPLLTTVSANVVIRVTDIAQAKTAQNGIVLKADVLQVDYERLALSF
jgi:hypothetical protein